MLLDRSASVGYYSFEEDGKELLEALLRTGHVLHPAHTRLAVITFARDVTTVIDGITGAPLSGCTLFAKNGQLQNQEKPRRRNSQPLLSVFVWLFSCHFCIVAGKWDEVRYDPSNQDGADFKSAVSEARSLLSAGRLMRPGGGATKQTVWILSDGEFGTDEGMLWASYLRDDGALSDCA